MGMMPPGSHGPVIWWGGWNRGRRKPESGPANSGLTGDPTIEPPQLPEGPKDLRGRWESLKQSVVGTTAALPQVLRLVWEASRPTTIGLFATTAIAGIIPTISVGITLMLTNAVVAGININAFHVPDRVAFATLGVPWLPGPTLTAVQMIVLLAALQFAIFVISALLNTLRNITQQLLQNSVSMRIQLMVMEKAASLDLPFYEDPASYDLLRRAQNDSINRPVLMIATAFGLLQTILTLVTMIAFIFGVSWILAIIVLLSPVPAFIADTRYGWRGYNIARWGSRLLRRMNYMVSLVTTDSFAKEVKLFGLGHYFIDRYQLVADAFYASQRAQVVRRYMTGFALGNLSTIVTSITYLYIALQAIAGRLTLGALTAYTQAAVQVQNSIQSLLGGFSGMYEHNLYLNNLIELMAQQPSLPVAANPKPVPKPLRGEISFENVTFAYPGAEAHALTEVSFTIKPGETLAVVGRNGAGKTTLFKLICRLYDPTGGRILIDGVDIRDYEPDDSQREHRPGQRARDRQTRRCGQRKQAGGVGRAHRHASSRLRHGSGQVVRRRGQPVGRRVAEGGAGPRVHARGRSDPAPRRAHLRARRAGRVRPLRKTAFADPWPDGGLHLAPLLDGPASRPDHLPRARRAGRGRHAQGIDAFGRPLCEALPHAGRRLHRRRHRRACRGRRLGRLC